MIAFEPGWRQRYDGLRICWQYESFKLRGAHFEAIRKAIRDGRPFLTPETLPGTWVIPPAPGERQCDQKLDLDELKLEEVEPSTSQMVLQRLEGNASNVGGKIISKFQIVTQTFRKPSRTA